MAAERSAALQSPVAPGAVVARDVDDGVPDGGGGVEGAAGPAELLPAAVVVVDCACGWLGPHPLSISAAAVAAVDMTNPWEIR